MKTIIIGLIAVLFLSVPVHAGEEKIAVITKQGNVYHWKTMYEKDNSVCTRKSYGEMCIPKSEIKEIAKGDKNAEDKITEEKRTDVERVEIQSTSYSDTTSQTTGTKTTSKNDSPSALKPNTIKKYSEGAKWNWGDKSVEQKLQQERQQIINSYKSTKDYYTPDGWKGGTGTIK